MGSSKFPSHLKVAFFPSNPFFISTSNEEYDQYHYQSIEAAFLKTLSRSLNFSFEMVASSATNWSSEHSFGKYKGVIGMLERGEADIGLSHLDITESLMEVVDFSTPYDVADKTFATDYPKAYPSHAAFTYPFNKNLWLFILFAFTSIAFSLLSLASREVLSIHFIIKLFGTLCKQSYNVKETSALWRFVFVMWLLFVSVIIDSYSAVLFSYLTIPLTEEGIKTVKELSRAVEKGHYSCLIANNTNDLHLLLSSEQKELKTIGEKAVLENWFYNPANGSADRYITYHTAIMANRLILTTPPFHDRHVSEDSFGIWYIGIAMSKAFCCEEALNLAILRILSVGLFQKYQRDELSHEGEVHLSENDKQRGKPLKFPEAFGVFIPLLCGLSLSLTAFVCEVTYFYRNTKLSNWI